MITYVENYLNPFGYTGKQPFFGQAFRQENIFKFKEEQEKWREK